jgi:hypothetical protein
VRTPLCAVKVQMMQPLLASRAKTVPFWLPTNSRSPATVGCDHAEVASGNPNAHLRVSFGTSAAVSPARSALCARAFELVGNQPVQASVSGDSKGSRCGTAPGGGSGEVAAERAAGA